MVELSSDERLKEFYNEIESLREEKPNSELLNLLVDIAVELEAIDVKANGVEDIRANLESISNTLRGVFLNKKPKTPYNMYGFLVGVMKSGKRLSVNSLDTKDREYFRGQHDLAKDLLSLYF
jgi:hypothetical protein